MAERNASQAPNYDLVIPGFQINANHYLNVRKLSSDAFPYNLYPDASSWAKRNDVPGFIRSYLKISTDQSVSLNDLYRATGIYTDAWDKGEQGKRI
ncbi:hypothetical protein A2631_05865 [Candidatus Daviesbacteria bacterium RIFCSPHIGHO2_01_FULL_44_29]|uniref:Uncharacterized protein n=1 Tax=Candidatus Daviesbacteria bacterium RIFCSPHIGHO2_02_FULL_43_12 TaxID=1797776 RepID=A0A1F5KJ93_9BACT|nr:MAG: hypothetical protein A2631_05865 [Candidatus Daviesbacteria bacterium RIFCSPHIGHO2_01_FULL_44_29]OGE40968.1 MAG: hypothetical protein A3D25_02930 [Candidatus Daviesbacteria bacterium RIFCSPHIGHO2_02_FULL_43_12]OGE69881.1 MAG: hypothetical protein A3B55_05740 [Candidatus Daviesbacteria bacterium RIFCSPLOWO2_01_FULL_43_15]